MQFHRNNKKYSGRGAKAQKEFDDYLASLSESELQEWFNNEAEHWDRVILNEFLARVKETDLPEAVALALQNEMNDAWNRPYIVDETTRDEKEFFATVQSASDYIREQLPYRFWLAANRLFREAEEIVRTGSGLAAWFIDRESDAHEFALKQTQKQSKGKRGRKPKTKDAQREATKILDQVWAVYLDRSSKSPLKQTQIKVAKAWRPNDDSADRKIRSALKVFGWKWKEFLETMAAKTGKK